jgi:hypothetical protein
MVFKSDDYDAYTKRKQCYEANTTKAYALIWEQCAKSMQGKIKATKDFESTIKGNPVELLKLIMKNCLSYQEHCCEWQVVWTR